MNAFKDFGIETSSKAFTGDKIKMNKVLNKSIRVLDYKIAESKYKEKGNGKCLQLQIEVGDVKNVVFTGSANLMDMIDRVPKDKFPFTTTIIEENERFQFT